MKNYVVLTLALLGSLSPVMVDARDTQHKLQIGDVLDNPEYEERLRGVQFFFAEQEYPAILEDLGEWRTNKKTNAFGKSDEEACKWVMFSALLQLHQRTLELGGDAVVDIRSTYNNREFASETEYVCGAGALMAGLALKC